MQNPAIRTLKAIREIHNEPHQWQVHMGDWHSEMTQTTWQFAAPLAINILTTTAVNIGRVPVVVCWFWGGFLKNVPVDLDADLEFSRHGATVLTVQMFVRIDWCWLKKKWTVSHSFCHFFFCVIQDFFSANINWGWYSKLLCWMTKKKGQIQNTRMKRK